MIDVGVHSANVTWPSRASRIFPSTSVCFGTYAQSAITLITPFGRTPMRICVLYVTSALMAFTLHHPKVMLRMLVAVLHLDRVAANLRVAGACEIALIELAGVAAVCAPQWLQL